jgi:hypothetical protein
VGRYFPLTLVAQIDIDICPLEFATTRTSWFEALEALVAVALDESTVDLESFDARVAQLAQPLEPHNQGIAMSLFELLEHSKFPAQGSAWRMPLGTAAGLQSAVNAFAYRDLTVQLRPVSVWWSEGSNAAAASWLSLRGLPEPSSFGAMLNGQWAQHGWKDLGELSGSPTQSPAAAPVDRVADHPNEPIGLASPHVTLPAAQLSAIEGNRAAFIVRPEVGLWATAAVVDTEADTAALRFIAEALQQIVPAGSLTGLVEAVRQALTEVHQQLCYLSTREVQRVDAQGHVIAMLVYGNECALVSAGPIQTLRVRARVLEELDTYREPESDDSGLLMDLLAVDPRTTPALGASDFRHLHVHYERLQREDQWILCARTLIGSQHIGQLAATVASGMPLSVQLIMDTIALLTVAGAVPPLMTVEM